MISLRDLRRVSKTRVSYTSLSSNFISRLSRGEGLGVSVLRVTGRHNDFIGGVLETDGSGSSGPGLYYFRGSEVWDSWRGETIRTLISTYIALRPSLQ